ncbi:translocation/assembly module TamB domain-containing protein [Microvirga antarctica]|uniref:translocation/assembly module TamB domain-containing protein n=1 Tax=Microvirga antarctica TaxID=2819233 RepID=UPI001B3130FE|nr:translocation/assembly module TamB domain-containing protein [Microvirga antarctica]
MMRRFFIPSVLVAAFAIFLALTLGTKSDEADKGFLSGLISRALSTPSTQVSIGDVEGALSSDATIRNITISDKDGVWFRLDRVRFVWRRLALLSRRLEVDKLEIGKLEILRRPIASDETVPGADQPLLPELPVKVQIADFLLRELVLGEPVIGTAAQLTASGAASLGDPKEGLTLRFDGRRLDAPGTLAARLNYAAEKLDLTLALDEPAGGILSRAANIPGLPPVKLDLAGTGTLDAFGATLNFNAGNTIGATGEANLKRQGAFRHLVLDLNAQIEGLLPAPVAPVFAGTTELDSVTIFADDGKITIPQFSIVSRTARLDATGTMAADRSVDLRLSARAVPTGQDKTVAGLAEIKTLVFNGSVAGQLSSPQIRGDLEAEQVSLPSGRLGKLDATFSVLPNGPLSEPATRIAIAADAKASGVALSDPALARAVGDQISLVIRATASPDGTADVETAQLTSPSVNARYSGKLGSEDALGALVVNAPDLARFGDLASLRLRGALALDAQVQGLLSKAPVNATIDAKVTTFSTGLAAVDGLSGGVVSLKGGVRMLPKGGFGFSDLRLSGAHASARLDGAATAENVAVDAAVDLPDLRLADRRLSGQGSITAKVTGRLERPDATLHAEMRNGTALGRPIPQLAIDASGTDLLGLIDLRTTLAGTVDGKPANGTLRLAKRAEGGWHLDGLALKVGSAQVAGQFTLDAAQLAVGRLSIDARNLDDLSPLVLTRLGGDIRAEMGFDAPEGKQNMQLDASGQRLRIGDATVDRLSAKATLADIYAKPIIDAAISANQAVVGGETFSQIRLDAKGSASASDVVLAARARGFDIDARGRLVPDSPVRFELAAFTARRDRRQIALANPATISFGNGAVIIDNLDIAVDGGTVSVDGRAGATLDLRLAAKAVPLSAADILMPGTGLSGTLEGTAQIGGTGAAPTGDWRVRVSRLVAAQARGLGAPPIEIAAQGRLSGGATTVDGTITAGKAGTFRLNGSVPLSPQGNLDVSAKGRLDLSVANGFLSVSGRQVSGAATIDVRATGALTQPAVNGSVVISGGSFRDALQGIRLDNIQGRLSARGTDLVIESFSASTRNSGTLSASGRVRLDPAAGFPGDIRITGQKAELVSNDLVQAVADLSLALSGPLSQNPRVAGQVRIVSLDVTVPERLPTTVRPIPGTKHIKPPPIVAKRLAMEAQARATSRRASPFNAVLDLTLSAPNRIYVRGRGIDAELGGDLRLSGTLQDPIAIGAFELRRGRLTVVGTRLDFTRGLLTFTGDLTPELDFVAETNAGEVTARVSVSGTAREPQFAFSSDPDLPQDEVLSRILFSKASGGLSVTQALTLAQAAAQFSGGGGDDVFESLRKSLGVQGLDISLGAEGGPAIGISRAISDRVSVGVKAGASTSETGVSVDIDVTRRVRIQGEVGADGNTSLGVGAEWEY